MATQRPVIAQVLHRLYLAGAEVLAAALARKLRDQYDFIFLCLDEVGPLGEQLQAEGFTVIDLQRRPGVDMAVARRIAQATREHRIDLMHPHQYTPFFYAAASRGLLRGRLGAGPPILFTEHGRHYPDRRSLKRVVANQLLLRGDDRVTAVGEFSKQALVDNEGIAARRIEVILNGIDPQAFCTPGDGGATRAAVRSELGLTPRQPVVLQVARFHPVKDHGTSIRAFAAVRQAIANEGAQAADSEPVLLLAGDGDKRVDMEALARELSVGDAVRFLGVRSDIARLMAAADVFVLSSVSEAISVTLLEAMGAGLPICATGVGGNGEVVADGETGLLSPRADHAGLAANILRMLRDPALRQRMGAAGRDRLLTAFTEQRMHDRYAQVFAEMLSK